ncbi:MAG: C1 family peptidase [Muribaculaceae bacterium]|nr:C1 family peptidase [Muribaculaceae bacterium]
MKKLFIVPAVALLAVAGLNAKESNKGGISEKMLNELRESYQPSASDRAISNALASTDINTLALNQERKNNFDTHFSHKVKSKGISNQKSSGRCWLFTGLNVIRARMIEDMNLPAFQLSQNYNFFWDQLEKSNLFLQSIIDTANLPADDKTVDWLFANPISDGGQFTGVSDILMKYGVVPATVMAETKSSESTSTMRMLLATKLRQWGLELRKAAADGAKPAQLETMKTDMLKEVYRYLALNLGVPPTEFTWTRTNAKGEPVETKTYTPKSFYDEYVGKDLKNDFVMLMNDPSRPYYQTYEIDLDRHAYDGRNWTYVNVPMEEIKEMAIASIKDSTMMYFSCDVGKYMDRQRGALDLDTYDYNDLFGTDFTAMNKAERIATHASASSHAMTLAGVDLDENGKPVKWLVENSWGPGANDGHLIMTDPWFDEYMFRLVVNKKYALPVVLETLKKTPVKLPAWDPLFAPED